MMNEKRSYKVQIFEEPYVLVSNEPEPFVLKAVDMVNNSMKEISHQSSLVDIKKIAVLTALRFANIVLQNERFCDESEHRLMALKDYIEQELLL